MSGTSGRTDDTSLWAAITCWASACGVLIASAIGRTEGVCSRRSSATNKKTPPNGRVLLFGTSGRTRTDTLLRAGDFESPVSTNSTTLAYLRPVRGRAGIIAVINSGSTDLDGFLV